MIQVRPLVPSKVIPPSSPRMASFGQCSRINEMIAASLSRSARDTQSFRDFRSAPPFPSCSQCFNRTAAPRRAASDASSTSFFLAVMRANSMAANGLCSKRSMQPRTISRYRVGRLIGAGGMGEVYLAEDETLNRKVALKLLPARFTRDEERVRRFQREARAASALNHPNIITIYEIGHTDSVHYIATEYIEGETLREVMAKRRLNAGEVLDVATGVAGALAAAHDAGIIHRDIKPENIMVRPD